MKNVLSCFTKPDDMKKILLFSTIALSLTMGCKKKDAAKITSAPYTYSFLQYWQSDTLLNGSRVNPTDTFYAFNQGDSTGVMYHGNKLYIFGIIDSSFIPVFRTYIGPVAFDTSAAYSRCTISQHKYWSATDAALKDQVQLMTISQRAPHFSTSGDAWYIGKPL